MRLNCVLVVTFGLFATNSVFAQPPAQTGTLPVVATPSYPSLYRMNDVSSALKLTQDQISRLNDVTADIQARYRDDYAKLGTLNDDERYTRMQELNRRYYNDWNTGTRDIFNDTQRSRYQQLGYQYDGFNTFYYPDAQKQLNLSEDQLKALRTHWDWSNQQWQNINRVAATDATKAAQLYRDYWTARQERLTKYLTPEQQRAWGEMIGEAYTFQPTFSRSR